jgi:hypothetical protein
VKRKFTFSVLFKLFASFIAFLFCSYAIQAQPVPGIRSCGITISGSGSTVFQSFLYVKGADGQTSAYTVSVEGTNQYTDNYIWGRSGEVVKKLLL